MAFQPCHPCLHGEGHASIADLMGLHGIPLRGPGSRKNFHQCDYCDPPRWFEFKIYKDAHEESGVHDAVIAAEAEWRERESLRQQAANLLEYQQRQEESIAQREEMRRQEREEEMRREQRRMERLAAQAPMQGFQMNQPQMMGFPPSLFGSGGPAPQMGGFQMQTPEMNTFSPAFPFSGPGANVPQMPMPQQMQPQVGNSIVDFTSPAPSFSAAAPLFGLPSPSFGSPPSLFGAPSPSSLFGSPAPSFSAPGSLLSPPAEPRQSPFAAPQQLSSAAIPSFGAQAYSDQLLQNGNQPQIGSMSFSGNFNEDYTNDFLAAERFAGGGGSQDWEGIM
jgi:hypothetical protein